MMRRLVPLVFRPLMCVVFASVLGLAEPQASNVPEFDRLRDQCRERRRAGDLKAAEELGLRMLAMAETPRLRKDPGFAAIAHEDLGMVYEFQGRYQAAETMYRKMLAYWEGKTGADSIDTGTSLSLLVTALGKSGKAAAAEPLAVRATRLFEAHPKRNQHVYQWAEAYDLLGQVYQLTGRYRDAVQAYERGIAVCEHDRKSAERMQQDLRRHLAIARSRLGTPGEASRAIGDAVAAAEREFGADSIRVADVLVSQGADLLEKGKYQEAAQVFERITAIRRKQLGPEHPQLALALWGTARAYRGLGKYREAEPLLKEAIPIAEKAGNFRELAQILDTLGIVYGQQQRYDEAIAICKRARAVREEKVPEDQAGLAASRHNLATLYASMAKLPAEAEGLIEEAVKLRQSQAGSNSPEVMHYLSTLATIRKRQGRTGEAEQLQRQLIAAREKALGADHPEVALELFNLGRNLYEQRRAQAALAPLARAAEIFERNRLEVPLQEVIRTYAYLARVEFAVGQHEASRKHLAQVMEMSERERLLLSGTEVQRAAATESNIENFETIVALQTEWGDCGMAFSAMERARARSLSEQMAAHQLDFLSGVPAAQAEPLRRRQQQAHDRIAEIMRQLKGDRPGATPAGGSPDRKTLLQSLVQAQEELQAVDVDIANISPAARLAVARSRQVASLEELRGWARQHQATVLEYFVGLLSGFVLVVPADEPPRLVELSVSKEQADVLKVSEGPLTSARLDQALTAGGDKGVLGRLQDPRDSAAQPSLSEQLAVLCDVLLPKAVRGGLDGAKYKRLVVLPDGVLTRFPFDALVVEGKEKPKYLLDTAPPVLYAPSATILLNLSARPKVAGKGVLSVGDARYGTEGSPESRVIGGAMVKLPPLPYTQWETAWVAEVFVGQHVPVEVLKGQEATERSVVAKAKGRALVHIACHGLVDPLPGNRYGCLALTAVDEATPDDDGLLTLAEIYGMALGGCELAILSACQTNSGPEHRGEGVWSLSRGFLVAGARRVAANNWPVDDEATATLISLFADSIAPKLGQGKTPDYAASLQTARRSLRQQTKWSHPFFWAPLILLGAD